MNTLRAFFRGHKAKRAKTNDKNAKRTVLEELFNDVYDQRGRIYKVNFIRGIYFGAGSALGGTIVIALLVWVLSLFVNAPLIGDLFKNAQQSIEQTTQDAAPKATD
jgi:hypothetical protein